MRLITGFTFVFLIGSIQLSGQDAAIRKFNMIYNIISSAYVDSVNGDKLVEDAIYGMLENLDPHSVYIPKSEVEEMNEPLVGNFEGIGIQFNILRDTIIVVSPIIGGPSEELGIQSGDKIVTINDSAVVGPELNNNLVIKKLRGQKGTKVKVGIYRKGANNLIDFTITRDKIPIYSIDAFYMATDNIGYIKISRFARNTMDEFAEAVLKLKEQNVKHLILDLKGNGGGYLNIAIELADEFISKDQRIVYTAGDNQREMVNYSTAKGNFETGKVVVLIDEGSASASEIVSGAIQDLDRGIVIGRRSFGKGLVQKPYQLSDGSELRLTVAKYYTPSGRCIQKPYGDKEESYENEIYERYKNGEFYAPDSSNFPDSLKYLTKNKRTVFGGGGIMPDIFIPLDTSLSTNYYSNLLRKGVLNNFVLSYMDAHREELTTSYKDITSFKSKFKLKDGIIADFTSFGAENDVEKNEKELEISLPIIQTQLKALIARNLFGTSAYYEIANETNDSYLKAIEVIEGKWFDKLNIDYK